MALSKTEREQINKDIERVGEVAGAKCAEIMNRLLNPWLKCFPSTIKLSMASTGTTECINP